MGRISGNECGNTQFTPSGVAAPSNFALFAQLREAAVEQRRGVAPRLVGHDFCRLRYAKSRVTWNIDVHISKTQADKGLRRPR
jgi:hypothetical protein